MQPFLGLAHYYRRFIKCFFTIVHPMLSQTIAQANVELVWGSTEEEAFEFLRKYLTSEPIITYRDFTKKF